MFIYPQLAAKSDIALEDLAFVVDCESEIMHLAIYLYVHLIKMPPLMAKAAHRVHALPFDITGEQRPEPVPPEAHRLMANVDAAFKQQVLHIPERQWEANVHHHHEPDHLG